MDFLSFKALAIAGQQGQKIWTIDKNNLDLALSKINLGADAESDIRNAVNTGRIATAHESRINFNGWIGEGYILMDPKTGAGAYMISGGGNGGLLSGFSEKIAKYFLLGGSLQRVKHHVICFKIFYNCYPSIFWWAGCVCEINEWMFIFCQRLDSITCRYADFSGCRDLAIFYTGSICIIIAILVDRVFVW